MAEMKFTVDINLNQNQLKSPVIHKAASDPSSPVEGQIYFNTVNKKIWRYDGTQWLADGSGTVGTIDGTIGAGGTAQALGVAYSGGGTIATITVPLATGSLDGALSAGDKTKLNGATASSTANTLVLRDGNGTFNITSPTSSTHPATKGYVDSALAGLDFQKDILNIQIDATLDPGATPTTGDRYIITSTGTLHANFGSISGLGTNDIVEYNGAAWVVSYDVSAQGEGALTWNRADNNWYRYDGTSWDEFGGLAGITAGAGLTKTGQTLDIIAGNDSLTINADNMLVRVDNSTIETASGVGIRLKDSGITFAKVASAMWGPSLDTTGSVVNVKGYTWISGATVARVWVSATTTVGSGSPVTFTHNLNTQGVSITVLDSTTNEIVGMLSKANGVNTVTVTSNTSLDVKVVVIG